MLASNAGRLRLDTGNFIFDNYADKDVQKSIAAQLGYDIANPILSTIGGSYYYASKKGVTYATVGAGDIIVRNAPGQSLAALNRDIKNVQRTTNTTLVDLRVPGVQLKGLVETGKVAAEAVEKVSKEIEKALGPDAASYATRRMSLLSKEDQAKLLSEIRKNPEDYRIRIADARVAYEFIKGGTFTYLGSLPDDANLALADLVADLTAAGYSHDQISGYLQVLDGELRSKANTADAGTTATLGALCASNPPACAVVVTRTAIAVGGWYLTQTESGRKAWVQISSLWSGISTSTSNDDGSAEQGGSVRNGPVWVAAGSSAPDPDDDGSSNGSGPSRKVYRVLRDDEDPTKGLSAKNPSNMEQNITYHVRSGSSKNAATRFISTTSDIRVAEKLAASNPGARIVEIDLNLVEGKIYDFTKESVRRALFRPDVARL